MGKSKKLTKRQSREQAIRREKVKELYIQGMPATKISTKVGVHYNTVLSDIEHIKENYLEMAVRDPALIQKQFAKVEELLDEVKLVKSEYWKILNEIDQDRKEKQETYDKEYEQSLAEAKDEKEKQKLKKKSAGKNFSTRLETLRAIMTRVDHEAKLLNLFNSGTIIEKNYVSMDTLKQIMVVFKGIIMDLIPKEKQNYAIRRMKTIDIKGISPDDVKKAEDAEFTEEKKEDKPTEVKEEKPKQSEEAVVKEKENTPEDFDLDSL